jgi:hypothetical protein
LPVIDAVSARNDRRRGNRAGAPSCCGTERQPFAVKSARATLFRWRRLPAMISPLSRRTAKSPDGRGSSARAAEIYQTGAVDPNDFKWQEADVPGSGCANSPWPAHDV